MSCSIEQVKSKFSMSKANYDIAFLVLKTYLEQKSISYKINLATNLKDLLSIKGWDLKMTNSVIDTKKLKSKLETIVSNLETIKSGDLLNIDKIQLLDDSSVNAMSMLEYLSGDESKFIVGIENNSGYLDDSFDIFRIIAPYVNDGSYIQCIAEDDDEWRFSFEDRKMIERRKVDVWK